MLTNDLFSEGSIPTTPKGSEKKVRIRKFMIVLHGFDM